MTDAVTLDTYTFAVLLIAVMILGVLIGWVGSPLWEAHVQRRIALRRLRQFPGSE